jgi:carbonic anhydrase
MTDKSMQRRQFFRLGITGGAGALLGGLSACGASVSPACHESSPHPRRVVTLTKAWQEALRPQEIVEFAKAGNQRFLSDQRRDRDYLHDQRETAAGQHPAAAVLGCIDSRAPAEILLDAGIGDMFSVRIAGNFVNSDIAGSLEYACQVAGAKVVVVMGHTRCGAIKGAIDDVKLGNLTGLLAKLRSAIDATQHVEGEERSSQSHAFVDAVAMENVRQTVAELRRVSPLLQRLESEHKILIVGSMYDVVTGRVDFLS